MADEGDATWSTAASVEVEEEEEAS